jgi:hypothetical protein
MPAKMAGPSSVCAGDSLGTAPVFALYGTSACHLCDEAMSILGQLGCTFVYVDIACEDAKFDEYAMRIPVLRRIDSGAELGWPFDPLAVLAFIS